MSYVLEPAAAANAIRLYEGSWSSKVPGFPEFSGPVDLFNDERISWAIEHLPSLKGKRVLELGPLEGGHTAMLEAAGAHVTAIESNREAFARCLVVKNELQLSARFVLGYFTTSPLLSEAWDVVFASGVLYHMSDPIALMTKVSRCAPHVYFWTHYWSDDETAWAEHLKPLRSTKWRVDRAVQEDVGGKLVRKIPQSYGDALTWSGFCGGPEEGSYWMDRSGILTTLGVLGYDKVSIGHDVTTHPNGPSFSVFASRNPRD